MSDRYGDFVQSALGQKVAKNLGLPLPIELDRYEMGEKVVRGDVLFGSSTGQDESVAAVVAQTLSDLHATVFAANDDPKISTLTAANITVKNSQVHKKKYKVVVFDASNISSADELKQLYRFFNPVARQIEKSGRVLVIGRPPQSCDDIDSAMAQRSLEGFVRSVAKEFKQGITAQLIYVKQGGEDNLVSTLRFFASARSAYVSGQVINVTTGAAVEVEWSQPLANKTMLVTGASRGIGEAIARVLAREGAHVVCLDIAAQQADLHAVAGEIGGSTLTLDITQQDAAEKIAELAKKHGGLDAVIHNAGVTRDKTLANMDEKQWDLVIDVNLASIARINDYLLKHDALSSQARIVCVSSIAGIAGNFGQTNYATSKAGVIGLVQATAKQLASTDTAITINAVAPGFIETQMTAKIPFAIREAGRRMNSMSQGGQPIDVAETIAWLASPASGGVNGNVVRVCGQSLLGA